MRSPAGAKKNPPPTLRRGQVPWVVTKVAALPGFRLQVAFIDGLQGTVDMSAMIRSKNAGVFAALADPALFGKVFVDHGAVTWPGELDLAPDAMHEQIRKHGEWRLK